MQASRPVQGRTASERVAAAWQRHPLLAMLRHRRRLTLLRQLHSLVRAGFGMPTAFAELSSYGPDPATARAMREISGQVTGGAGFAEALARERDVFDEPTVALLAAGEETGGLERILERVIHQHEEMQRFRMRAVVMAIYPAYLLGGLLLFGPLLGVPGTIRAGGGVGEAAGGYVASLVGGIGFAVVAGALLFTLPLWIAALGWEERWDRVRLQLPVLGPLFRDLYASRFCLSLGTAIASGLEMGRSLELAARATGSGKLQAEVVPAVPAVRRGMALAEAVKRLGVLDGIGLGTLAIGEKTGELERMLGQLATDYQESANRRMKVLVYGVLLVIGGGAMLMIVSRILGVMFGPIWDYFHLFGRDGAN
ncbi:MAG: type II secretion system F family protein [Myxococcales bacterium]